MKNINFISILKSTETMKTSNKNKFSRGSRFYLCNWFKKNRIIPEKENIQKNNHIKCCCWCSIYYFYGICKCNTNINTQILSDK